jgi:molybdopterin synthase catalytic subunit
MAISVCEVSITESPLELPARSNNEAAGAVVDFWGVVRRDENGREINGIEYEAHPTMAEHQMCKLAQRAMKKFELTSITVRHRVGFVPAMEPSIVVHVESAHRGAAFKASQWIMDELKRAVPIWKHPVFTEGAAGKSAGKRANKMVPGSSTSSPNA